jgi:hypothetical protein
MDSLDSSIEDAPATSEGKARQEAAQTATAPSMEGADRRAG